VLGGVEVVTHELLILKHVGNQQAVIRKQKIAYVDCRLDSGLVSLLAGVLIL